MTIVVLVLLAGLAVVLFAFMSAVSIYNDLVGGNQNVDKAWSDIDVVLKQRHDELGKLVAVCEGYKNFERSTLEAVIKARSQYSAAQTPDQKIEASSAMTSAARGLLAVAESYPELKSSANFLQLQGRVTALEERIAGQREGYNAAANGFNIRIAQFPAMFVAGFMQLKPRPLYQVTEEDRSDVKIAFS